MKRILYFLVFSLILINDSYGLEGRLLRQPNSSDTEIVFSHAGDLYSVAIGGGVARKLTTSQGLEMFARFSKDGKQIAFVADYDGNRDIYVMPNTGGEPKRLTFSMDIGSLPERMGPDKIIMQWTNEGNILYKSRHESWQAWTGKLFTQSPKGGLPKQIEVPNSGFASLSPDGKKLAYNRIFREFRTWKRYRGGQADDIWIYDFATKSLENITNNEAQDIIPMWFGNKIYYLSDRDKTMNLFCYDISTKQTKKVTNFTEFDVKFPSIGAKHIAFENAGYIYLLDPTTDTYNKINIEIFDDYPNARTKLESVKDKISSFGLNNDGKKAYFGARGDIFTVPNGEGQTNNLTKTSGAHDRNSEWSPDGKWIAFISDKSGEDEVYITTPDGSQEIQLTNDSKSYRFALKWSPDSKKIIISDKTFRLQYIDIESKVVTDVHKSKVWELRDYSWSPDSKWIAYTDYNNNMLGTIYLYNLNSKEKKAVTDGFFSCENPVFTPGGKYLLFVSDRTFNPTVSQIEWNVSYSDMAKIYGITLKNDILSPFVYTEEKVEKEEAKTGANGKDEKSTEKKELTVEIEFDGIANRIFEFPIESANYRNLYPTKDHKLYYVKSKRGGGAKTYIFDVKDKKESEVGDFNSWDVSGDGSKMIISKGGNYYVENLSSKIETKNALKLDEMKVNLNRIEEWKQVFYEGWRQMKYFFYDPNMHGVDWEAIKKRYEQLLPFVRHRDDLTYIMGEMIGELNCGHAYVGGGDMPKVENVSIGLLGAEYVMDKSGAYKIQKIYAGRNWEEKTYSPLTEPGLNVKEGEYILEIDNVKLSEEYSPYNALVGKVGKIVKLKINSKSSDAGSREIFVKPIGNEAGLRYLDWVESRRKYVEDKTNGRVGYIHIPDMGVNNGLTEFFKYFMPQLGKEALVIDDRYNGGGNVSPMIAERLLREVVIVKTKRNQEVVSASPDAIMPGPLVCLINELSASDGDLFPYRFKNMGLGKLIGKRSWGGVIGIYGSLPFLDGGYMMKPESANFGANGEWILEGVGMIPDIEVDNDPASVLAGKDPQLDKAIEVILEEIKTNKKNKIPSIPVHPKKN